MPAAEVAMIVCLVALSLRAQGTYVPVSMLTETGKNPITPHARLKFVTSNSSSKMLLFRKLAIRAGHTAVLNMWHQYFSRFFLATSAYLASKRPWCNKASHRSRLGQSLAARRSGRVASVDEEELQSQGTSLLLRRESLSDCLHYVH